MREIVREYLRAIYSDLMKTLHVEAFYEGTYQPDEVKYAIGKVKSVVDELESGVRKTLGR